MLSVGVECWGVGVGVSVGSWVLGGSVCLEGHKKKFLNVDRTGHVSFTEMKLRGMFRIR